MATRRRPRFEGIEYEPKSVKEMLTDMKDTSELVIDLAYAAIIFDSVEMAEEVEALEERLDKLLYHIRLNAMLAARTVKDAEQLAGILQVANAAENISNAAGDLVKILDTDIRHRPFLPFLLADADEKTRLVTVASESSLAGKNLESLNVEQDSGMRIIAVKRRGRWFYDPQDDFVLASGDILVAIGVEDGYQYLKDCAEGKKKWGEP